MKIIIPKEQAGQRIDSALSALTARTRSSIQVEMREGRVRINGRIAKKNERVTPGDEVVIEEQSQASERVMADPRIVTETEEYLILDKPSGMAVHSASHHRLRTVVDFILEKYPAIASVGEDPIRPGIVHRLDMDASGVMVVAKTQESFESLKRQFKLRRVRKQYVILVFGRVTPIEGEIRSFLSRSRERYTRYAASAQPGGREALTRYWVEQQFKDTCLVRVEPQTGRTHQIRVHFFSRGYPLVGDRVYRSKKQPLPLESRLMLHASLLGFKDGSGAYQEYGVALGEDFTNVLERVKK